MPRLTRILWPIVLSGAVGACTDGILEPCESMCEAAMTLKARCLDADGARWSETRWGSQTAFAESCETWSWQAHRLERDARRRGVANSGDIRALCDRNTQRYREPGAECEALDGPGWALPWEEE